MLPEAGFESDQDESDGSDEAVQQFSEVAQSDDQVKVDDSPWVMVEGEAEILQEGKRAK